MDSHMVGVGLIFSIVVSAAAEDNSSPCVCNLASLESYLNNQIISPNGKKRKILVDPLFI